MRVRVRVRVRLRLRVRGGRALRLGGGGRRGVVALAEELARVELAQGPAVGEGEAEGGDGHLSRMG